MTETILTCLVAFLISVAAVPVLIAIQRRIKAGQPILSYVDNHASKSGTATFGGVAFLLSLTVCALIFFRAKTTLALFCVVVTLSYGIIGFLDDFLKAKNKQNQGLSALQKIIFQTFVSLIVSVFAYRFEGVGGELYLPFTLRRVNLGLWSIPFNMFLFLSFTNAVNLTDGLDGLAGKTSLMYLVGFAVLAAMASRLDGAYSIGAEDKQGLARFALTLAAAIGGFLAYNSFPAKIFMGDTGSLGIGGAIGALAVVSGLALYAPLMGIVFVWTCVSDVLQVTYYKKTKKRIFLMAPFHHHLERKGWHENKIVSLYVSVTFVCVTASVLITHLLAN